MTPDPTGRSSELAQPPHWASALLASLLSSSEAETVLGDLIEEYRDAVLPARGQRQANIWFVRQVAGFAWRAPVVWGLVVAAFIAGRFVLDTFAPPANYAQRSFFTTWSSILLYLLAGAWGAWRTGRARTGTFVAVCAHAIGWSVSIAITSAIFIGVIRNNATMLNVFRDTGGWGEQWLLPLMLLPFVLVLGSLGGVCGRSLAKRSRT
jgi:hypothetical protein